MRGWIYKSWKVHIAWESLQRYFIIIDFPVFFLFISKCSHIFELNHWNIKQISQAITGSMQRCKLVKRFSKTSMQPMRARKRIMHLSTQACKHENTQPSQACEKNKHANTPSTWARKVREDVITSSTWFSRLIFSLIMFLIFYRI